MGLEFIYNSQESTTNWCGEYPHEFVTDADKAIETAIAELTEKEASTFYLSVFDGDDKFIKSN